MTDDRPMNDDDRELLVEDRESGAALLMRIDSDGGLRTIIHDQKAGKTLGLVDTPDNEWREFFSRALGVDQQPANQRAETPGQDGDPVDRYAYRCRMCGKTFIVERNRTASIVWSLLGGMNPPTEVRAMHLTPPKHHVHVCGNGPDEEHGVGDLLGCAAR